MTEVHKITAHPIPMTGCQTFCGRMVIVKKGKRHIAPPIHQYKFEPKAGTIPKKWRPTTIEITGNTRCFRFIPRKMTTATKIRTISAATAIVYGFALNVCGCDG